MGHDARGAQNLGETKLDLFMQAVEGWLNTLAAVLNRHMLPQMWKLNGMDMDYLPSYVPDTAQRPDMDALSNFVVRMSQAGMPLFPDPDLESYIRDAAGLPDISENSGARDLIVQAQQQQAELERDSQLAQNETMRNPPPKPAPKGSPAQKLDAVLKASMARRARQLGINGGG